MDKKVHDAVRTGEFNVAMYNEGRKEATQEIFEKLLSELIRELKQGE